jgi:hypothetical protein
MSADAPTELERTFNQLTRRGFLSETVTRLAIIGTTATFVSGAVSTAALAAPTQANWRRCGKCNLLFWNGYRDKGRCPANGGHAVYGRFDYVLTYDDSTGPGQGDWRFCARCKAIFFNGYPAKGVCAGNSVGHEAAGYNFFLFHDRKPTGSEEANWRFCNQCHALFFSSARETSVCAKGGNHVAAGYRFVLKLQGGNID